MIVEKTVKVEKEASELVEAIGSFAGKVMKHKAEGKPVPANLLESFTESMGKLMKGVSGAEKIPDEIKESKAAFANAIGLLPGMILAEMEAAPNA